MANRQRFSCSVKREIARRAVNAIGGKCCEKCGAVGVPLELHHLRQDAMQTAEAKKRKLTAADGAMWCAAVCHKEESAAQKPILAKVEKAEAAHWLPRTRSPSWPAPKPKDRSVTKIARGPSAFARQIREDA